jgi:hypothetical protein
MSEKPNLKIVPEKGRFTLQDDLVLHYGVYDTRKEAEQALEDWKAYFDAPLVF